MQIRIQGKKVQLIRNSYDPELKRSKQVVFASYAESADRNLSVGQIDSFGMNPVERSQFDTWRNDRLAKQDQAYLNMYASTIASAITDRISSVSTLTPEQANAVWDAISQLQAALRKAKFKKPVAVKAKDNDIHTASILPADHDK